jgi:putative nucleotidyltransferase with HDIG domain
VEPELKAKYRYVLDGISQIPSLPSIVSKIIGIINNPRTNAEDLVRHLEMDVGLSGKVLRLANSAYYGIPGGITSTQRAIIQLGFNAVSSIVISASVYNLFKSTEHSQTMNRVAFWRHSIETAVYCRSIAKLTQGALDPEISFTHGMLHDIGALAFDTAFPKEYASVVDAARTEKKSLEEKEREYFGMDHSQLGARILERWSLPEILREPIAYHHAIDATVPNRSYVLVLALANSLSHSKGVVLYPNQHQEEISVESVFKELGIQQSMEQVSSLFEEEMQQAKLIMNLLRS